MIDLSKTIQTARFRDTDIPGVQLKQLTTHTDERGFFREIIRANDDFFSEGFGQWSESKRDTGVIVAWHYHLKQVDWWFCGVGKIKAVLCDLRPVMDKLDLLKQGKPLWYWEDSSLADSLKTQEFILGEDQPAQVLKIPPGVAHGLKVLQGPAHLFYVTSREYDPADEGRIAYDSLGYDWDRRDIR